MHNFDCIGEIGNVCVRLIKESINTLAQYSVDQFTQNYDSVRKALLQSLH